MRMDRATTMAIVNRLEAKGYLVRKKSRSDRRKQALSLTEAGRRALSTAKRAIQQHHFLFSLVGGHRVRRRTIRPVIDTWLANHLVRNF